MSKPNAYLARHAETTQAMIEATERITRQMMVDTLQTAIHREFGWGYDRIVQLTDLWAEVYNHYHDALTTGTEADVLREHLDRELGDIIKDHQKLIPFDERYSEIKKITYSARKSK